MLAERKVVSGQNAIELTVNWPVSVLQPRPSPETSMPGPLPLNGYLVALRYVPGARMSPGAGTNSADQESPLPEAPKPAYWRPPCMPMEPFTGV